jgi:AcrR family transcriptional regulator
VAAHAFRRPADDATGARVLAAARALFAERGFHGTTMRDVAARARANVASGHYHFGSKRDLYVAVLRATFAEVRALLERGGAQVDPARLAAMSGPEVEALLEKRITLMLNHLLGPPPSLHGTLMMREMLDPSDALPIVVAEFIQPMNDEMALIVRRLAPGLDDATVVWCIASIMGQALFYRLTRPAILGILGLADFTPAYEARLAAHIARFAAGGITSAATAPRPRGRRAT